MKLGVKSCRLLGLFVLSLMLSLIVVSCGCQDTSDEGFNDDDESEEILEPPTELIAEGKGESIILSWCDNSKSEDGFRIYRRPTGTEAFEEIAEVNPNVSEYIDENLGPEKDFEYIVKTFINDVESDPSNVARAQTVPNAPSNLSIKIVSYDVHNYKIKLMWNDNSSINDGNKVERRKEGEDWQVLADELLGNEYIDEEVDCETSYEYRVKAFNEAGDSKPAGPISIDIPLCFNIEQVVSEKATGNTAIGVDSGGNVFIGYCSQESMDLKLAKKSNNNWQIYTIDSQGDVGFGVAIALDSFDHIHISYYDKTNGKLKYATNKTGAWQKYAVDSIGILDWADTSISVDSNGFIHISYYDLTQQALKYATNKIGGWQTFVIDGNESGTYNDISTDPSGAVHIAYYNEANEDLKYATNEQGIWQKYTLDSTLDVGRFASIALDSQSKVHISYTGYYSNKLMYVSNSLGNWQKWVLDESGYVGESSQIAIDLNDHVHISYEDYNGQTSNLKYITNSSGSWQDYLVHEAGEMRWVGIHTSIALDDLNNVHISYLADSFPFYATTTK